jgi:signal transduction histidine kinase
LLAISAFATVRGYYQSVDQQRFQGDATFYATRFKDDVTRHVTSLAAIRAFVSASRVVSRWEFSTFAQQILPQNPGFRAVLWVPSVTRKDRAAYEATLQKDGLYGLRIRQATSEGALANAGDRAAYLPITYVEPFDQNENLIGVDLSDTDFYADLFRDAGRDGHVAASPPLTRTLVAGTYGPAVLLAYALSPNTAQKPDAPANHATPQGYALGVLRLESIIQEVLGPSAPIQAAIAYQESVSQGPLLVMPDGKETAQRPDRWFQNAAFHQMIPFDIADRHYLLALRSVGNTSAVTSFYVPAGASLLVLTLTALLAQNMTSVMMRKRFVERAVVSRTAQLRAANETLRGEVEQRRQAEAELRVARDKAESASRSKSAFMANMSHELRTPLNAIIGFSSILAETQSGADLRHGEYAGEILVSGRHLLDLINDILDLTQMETMSKDDGLVYLGDCVIATVNQAQAAAQAAGVTLRVSLPEHLPALMGDSRRITKALSHLISNAVKFTHQGGAAAVVIQRNNDGALALEVADTGIGMPSEARDRLREAFSQYDGRLGRKYEGIGLGLTYVGKVAEMHDATLEIVSEQGKGTRVRMVFQSHRVVKELEVA